MLEMPATKLYLSSKLLVRVATEMLRECVKHLLSIRVDMVLTCEFKRAL